MIRERVGVPLRIIQMVRNPFDNIATIAKKTTWLDGGLSAAADYYFDLADRASRVRAHLDDEELLIIRHESLVLDAASVLAATLQGLGLSATPGYLDACASVVFDSPKRTRHQFDWTDELRRRVESRIESDELLRGYSFDDDGVPKEQPAAG